MSAHRSPESCCCACRVMFFNCREGCDGCMSTRRWEWTSAQRTHRRHPPPTASALRNPPPTFLLNLRWSKIWTPSTLESLTVLHTGVSGRMVIDGTQAGSMHNHSATHMSKFSFQYGFSVRLMTDVVCICSPSTLTTANGSGRRRMSRLMSESAATTALSRRERVYAQRLDRDAPRWSWLWLWTKGGGADREHGPEGACTRVVGAGGCSGDKDEVDAHEVDEGDETRRGIGNR